MRCTQPLTGCLPVLETRPSAYLRFPVGRARSDPGALEAIPFGDMSAKFVATRAGRRLTNRPGTGSANLTAASDGGQGRVRFNAIDALPIRGHCIG